MDNRKNNGGHSTKGFAGRKPKDEENRIRDLMQPYSLDAIQCLASIIINESAKDSDRISASKLVIEYTYGKPKETVDQNITMSDFNIKELFKVGSSKS
jgi:hypothetical protein